MREREGQEAGEDSAAHRSRAGAAGGRRMSNQRNVDGVILHFPDGEKNIDPEKLHMYGLDDPEIAAAAERRRIDRAKFVDPTAENISLDQALIRFVHVSSGPMIVDKHNTYRRFRPPEFAAAYAHCTTLVGKNAVPVTRVWSEHPDRNTAHAVSFNPAADTFFIEHDLRHLNLWSPPTWPKTDPKFAQRFFDHIDYLVQDPVARADLLDWLAHAVQAPAVRPHFHFLLVAPEEGTGRSWIAEVIRGMYGEQHASSIDLHKLLDDTFNSELSCKILMGVHEVKAPADERYSHRDRLKSLLTDEWLTVNEKHERRWRERFCTRFLMFTNRDDAIPLSETDRRVYVVRCADKPLGEKYYTDLYAKRGDRTFLAALWHSLLARDLSKFNPGRRAPMNDMKAQMIAAGRTEEQQTAIEFAQACPHPVIAASDLIPMLVPQLDDKERHSDRQRRVLAVAAALREIGKQTASNKIRLGTTSTRVWLLRDTSKWMKASTAKLGLAAKAAHDDCQLDRFDVDYLIERWLGKAP